MRRLLTLCLLVFGLALDSVAHAIPTPLFALGTGRVSQFAQSPDGRIFVPRQDGHSVRVFLENGAFVMDFGSFSEPTGIALDDQGYLYVADQAAHRVYKFTPGFVPVTNWGGLGTAPGQLNRPTNLAFSPDYSKLYVTELLGSRVSVFDKNGNFLSSFGVSGSGPGAFDYPFSLVVDPVTGYLFITNEVNDRVDVWTGAGAYVSSFGSPGGALGQFHFPVGIGRDPVSGDLYVTDQLNNRIQRFTPGGSPIMAWGTYGDALGQFYNPWSVFVSQAGNIWVGDTYNYRVQVFSPDPGGPVSATRSTWGRVKTGAH